MNKLNLRRTLSHLTLAAVIVMLPAPGFSQDLSAKAGEQPTAAAGAHAEEEAHAEEHGMLSSLLWPTANFLILAGGLYWFLRPPLKSYLSDRHESIRKDLVEAANVSAAASAELAEIDRKLQALPSELDALKHRGAEEIAAEERRIAAMATAERDRLLEQTRREIELQVRLAKRELVEHAADLSVQLAGERIQKSMTPADQERLVDRYVSDVKAQNAENRRP
jgi:F0F1-type ATP synthase membrane subunit b/b'